MAKSIIEEPDEFAIWCSDEQDYTVFWFPKMDDEYFMCIQQAGYGYCHSLEQIKALHKWLGERIDSA